MRLRRRARQASTLVVVAAIISAVMLSGAFAPSPAVGTADAAIGTECLAASAQVAMSYMTNGLAGKNEDYAVKKCTEYSTDKDSVTSLSATQAYAQALGVSDASENFMTVYQNRLEGTRSLATMEAKVVAANELNNGTSKSTTKFRVNQSIEDYYTKLQINLIRSWNAKVAQLEYMTGTAAEVGFLPEGDDGVKDDNEGWNFPTYEVELLNGSTVNMTVLDPPVHYGDSDYSSSVAQVEAGIVPASRFVNGAPSNYRDPNWDDSTGWQNYDAYNWRWVQDDPTVDGIQWTGIVSVTRYYDTFVRIDNQAMDVRSNVGKIVDAIYAEFTAGEINTSEFLSPLTLAHRAGTDWNSTGGYQYAAIQLATMGYSGSVNATATISTNKSQATYTGTVFYTGNDLPNGTLVAGKTYDTANLNGTFVMAVQGDSGETWVEEWKHAKVTVESLKDAQTGDTLKKTTVVEYTTSTSNVSTLKQQVQRLTNLTRKYRRLAKEDGGGGSTSSGISLTSSEKLALGALVGIVALAAVASRGGSGG